MPPHSHSLWLTSYAEVETMDASAAGGATDICADNVRKAWQAMFRLGQTPLGLQQLTDAFEMCTPIENMVRPLRSHNDAIPVLQDNVTEVAYWAQDAFSFLAMGS